MSASWRMGETFALDIVQSMEEVGGGSEGSDVGVSEEQCRFKYFTNLIFVLCK
jgi:hypothetical protein